MWVVGPTAGEGLAQSFARPEMPRDIDRDITQVYLKHEGLLWTVRKKIMNHSLSRSCLSDTWKGRIYSRDSVYHQIFFFLSFWFFLGLHLWCMEVPGLEVESELHLPACATATAMPDPSCVCKLHHGSWQGQIPDPLNEARDRTCTLMDTSRIHFRCATTGTPSSDMKQTC